MGATFATPCTWPGNEAACQLIVWAFEFNHWRGCPVVSQPVWICGDEGEIRVLPSKAPRSVTVQGSFVFDAKDPCVRTAGAGDEHA